MARQIWIGKDKKPVPFKKMELERIERCIQLMVQRYEWSLLGMVAFHAPHGEMAREYVEHELDMAERSGPQRFSESFNDLVRHYDWRMRRLKKQCDDLYETWGGEPESFKNGSTEWSDERLSGLWEQTVGFLEDLCRSAFTRIVCLVAEPLQFRGVRQGDCRSAQDRHRRERARRHDCPF